MMCQRLLRYSIAYLSVDAHLLIAGVEIEIAAVPEPSGAPALQHTIQLGGRAANLHRRQLDPAELFGNGGHLAGRDALDIISASASVNARSLRKPFSKACG